MVEIIDLKKRTDVVHLKLTFLELL